MRAELSEPSPAGPPVLGRWLTLSVVGEGVGDFVCGLSPGVVVGVGVGECVGLGDGDAGGVAVGDGVTSGVCVAPAPVGVALGLCDGDGVAVWYAGVGVGVWWVNVGVAVWYTGVGEGV
jgi:hypothetical protein